MILIIDMQHIYYRYWYKRDKCEAILAPNGRNVAHVKATYDECVRIIKDFAFHYDEVEAKVCICLDNGTYKKEAYPEYKANRQSRLDDDNIAEIRYIAGKLGKCGATVQTINGFEADDIIHTLVSENQDEDIAIYTNDADLLMHVSENTDVWVKRKSEYVRIKKKRFAQQLGFICNREALYNDIVLYKSCVGDPSDNIKGVHRFGDVAYKKKITALKDLNPNLSVPVDYEGVFNFARQYMEFTDAQFEQFEYSLKMVYPLTCAGLQPLRSVVLEQFSQSKK